LAGPDRDRNYSLAVCFSPPGWLVMRGFMTDSSSQLKTSAPLLDPAFVLKEARELYRFYGEAEPPKPYTCGVIADCIATIENLQSRFDAGFHATLTNRVAELEAALRKIDHTLTVHGHMDADTNLHQLISGLLEPQVRHD
jgi:hypothetical protein